MNLAYGFMIGWPLENAVGILQKQGWEVIVTITNGLVEEKTAARRVLRIVPAEKSNLLNILAAPVPVECDFQWYPPLVNADNDSRPAGNLF